MRKQFGAALVALAAAVAVAGCATYQEERDTTQPGKLQKAAFADGPWYTLRTVIDSPYEASFTFIGEAGTMEKIQWDIQEDYLYAYRTYEFVTGTDGARKEQDGNSFRGEPVAAYKIQSHFDLWHQYNAVTGEELPVLYEAQERPWYEREYFRVDWSTNHVASFNFMGSEICEVTGLITKDPVAYAPSKPGDPLQVYYGQRSGNGWSNHYDLTTTHELDTVDYIDVVNREFVHVNIAALFGNLSYADAQGCLGYPTMPLGGDMQVTYRQSFMKMDKDRHAQFEPVYYPDPAFERYGYFRDERYTYDRDRGTTDFLGYQMHRWNIWERTNDGVDEAGNLIKIPMADREIRPITYYINREAPEVFRTIAKTHLGKESWNRAFAAALKAANHNRMAGLDPNTSPADSLPTVFQVVDVDYSCGPNGDLACQQLGDLRYSFTYYVDRPSLGSPLGYGPSFSDPETGEIVMAVANFYGAALDTSRGYIGDLYDLIKGNITETDVMTGENIRQYFENAGSAVLPPTFPQINLDASIRTDVNAANGRAQLAPPKLSPELLELKHKLDLMKRDPAARTSPYSMKSLAGTPLEKLLVEADHRTAVMGFPSTEQMSEEMLEQISPFRNGGMIYQYQKQLDFWSRGGGTRELRAGAAKQGCVIRADLFNDVSMAKIIDDAEAALMERGLDDVAGTGDELASPGKDDVVDWIILHTFRGVEEHEVGHTLGLRHNFEGTADEENYHDEYWDIVAAHPEPQLGDFDENNDDQLDDVEFQRYRDEKLTVKRAREAAGVDFYTYSSIMDYSMHFFYNDVKGIGKYDHAAIKFGYTNQVEVYEDANNKGAHKENRVHVPYFMGGNICEAATDCTEPSFTVNGRTYKQQCRIGLSHEETPAQVGNGIAIQTKEELDAIRAEHPTVTKGVCSSVYTELALGEYDGWAVGQQVAPVAEPSHRFCSDERVTDRPFCSRYDEGKTAVEIVENTIEEYQRNYIFTNFRRYRLNFEPYFYFSRIMGRYFTPIGKIYQSLLYQLYYTPGFQTDPDTGMTDFIQASIIGLNFFGQVLATPDIGSYRNWREADPTPGDPSDDRFYSALLEEDWRYGEVYDDQAEMYVPLGVGKHLWTELEQGYYGAIQRYARMGTYWDKILAIEALSTRDWGFPQANDETYPINFYDGFKPELLAIFRGMATDDAMEYGPLVKTDAGRGNTVSQIKYRNYWTGRFFDSDAEGFGLTVKAPVNDPAADAAAGWRPLDPGGSVVLRLYSVIYALSYFPVFYDNTFPGYVQLATFGQVDPRNPDGLNDPDTVVHYSPKYRKLYAAANTLDQSSFTHRMVTRAKFLADERARFEAMTPAQRTAALSSHPRCEYSQDADDCQVDLLRWVDNELESVETMLNFTDDMLGAMGVTF